MDQSMALARFHNNKKFDNVDPKRNIWLVDRSIDCLSAR